MTPTQIIGRFSHPCDGRYFMVMHTNVDGAGYCGSQWNNPLKFDDVLDAIDYAETAYANAVARGNEWNYHFHVYAKYNVYREDPPIFSTNSKRVTA